MLGLYLRDSALLTEVYQSRKQMHLYVTHLNFKEVGCESPDLAPSTSSRFRWLTDSSDCGVQRSKESNGVPPRSKIRTDFHFFMTDENSRRGNWGVFRWCTLQYEVWNMADETIVGGIVHFCIFCWTTNTTKLGLTGHQYLPYLLAKSASPTCPWDQSYGTFL